MGKVSRPLLFCFFAFSFIEHSLDTADFSVDQLQVMKCMIPRRSRFLRNFRFLVHSKLFSRLEFIVALFLTTTTAPAAEFTQNGL